MNILLKTNQVDKQLPTLHVNGDFKIRRRDGNENVA